MGFFLSADGHSCRKLKDTEGEILKDKLKPKSCLEPKWRRKKTLLFKRRFPGDYHLLLKEESSPGLEKGCSNKFSDCLT